MQAQNYASPKGHWLLGHTWPMSRDPLGFLDHCAKDYGNLVPLRFVSIQTVLLNHPDLIEEVFSRKNRLFMRKGYLFHKVGRPLLGNGLFLSEGSFYHHQRDLAKPAFHKHMIDSYAGVMVAETQSLLNTWQSGDVRNVYSDYVKLTQVIIAQTLLGGLLSPIGSGQVTEALDAAMQVFKAEIETLLLLPNRFPTPAKWRFQRALKRLDQVVAGLINARRAKGVNEGNFLDLLLQATDQGDPENTPQQLRDEVVNLFLAGHETTAIALTWISWLLSQQPAIAHTLSAELQSVLHGRLPTLADLPQMAYTRAVILETLRLYPPVWVMSRVALADTDLAGYPISKGMSVIACQWSAHRNPEYFPEPDRFNPERWLNGLAETLPMGAYFPFSLGARMCLGKAFGMTELTLLLATIAQRFQFQSLPGQQVDLYPTLTLRPKDGMKLFIIS